MFKKFLSFFFEKKGSFLKYYPTVKDLIWLKCGFYSYKRYFDLSFAKRNNWLRVFLNFIR